MHLLATTQASIDDLIEPVDLGQTPGDVVALSFTDSDLAALAAAWQAQDGQGSEGHTAPSVSLRLVHLRDLRHPMSVDLWLDKVGAHAKVILLRLLGGLEWWRYGAERLAELARAKGIALVVLPGEDRDDPRLMGLSTVRSEQVLALLALFRAGGPANMQALLAALRALASQQGGGGVSLPEFAIATPTPVPAAACYRPGRGLIGLEEALAAVPAGAAVVPVVFYRSLYLADDLAPVDALVEALEHVNADPSHEPASTPLGQAPGVRLAAVPIMVASLKDPACAAFVRDACRALDPAVIVTTTAFAIGADDAASDPFAGSQAPVLQAIIANTRRAAWAESPRGLAAADLAMHVVLPELDGRVLAGAISFKDVGEASAELCFTGLFNRPEPDRIAALVLRVAALASLARRPEAKRRIAVLMPDYPGAAGRAGYAVGLDVPASVLALLGDLACAGYAVSDAPANERLLLERLEQRPLNISLGGYREALTTLPADAVAAVTAAWGAPEDDPDATDGVWRFRAAWFGRVLVALAPERGRPGDRRADYHDPALPPRHALLAFGLWLQGRIGGTDGAGVDALVHLGAHGTLEWLPGKAVALDRTSFPELVVGPLPVAYPFIVSNPGEAAQAKRRLAALTLGHLPAPTVRAGLSGPLGELERLVDEYAQAEGLDQRRRARLAGLILERAGAAGLLSEAGGTVEAAGTDEALLRIDAYLCDLKDMAVKDGLHVYGRGACGEEERTALLSALAGRRIAAGPAGAPGRGRTDVLPTGRNLFTSDPRTLPTATATDLAARAVDEILRQYRQEHGGWPRALVIDLWGSATLRTGGEEIAQGLLLMGCRPTWDPATGRVTGVQALPPAVLGRPRVDVTWRVSGLFRDLFPAQLALIDAAVGAVAARAGEDDDNPLAQAVARGEHPARIYGTAPGAYGAGLEELLSSGRWQSREELGRAYLAATSHAYGGAGGEARPAGRAFADRVAAADALVHISDDPGRDLLEGSADAASIGGFAAAAAALGAEPALIMLDTSAPEQPVARPLDGAIARIVRGRALSPAFIRGQMRHGPRGAAELAETVDRLVDFAATTDAVPSHLIDQVHDAYLGDATVLAFLIAENPHAARAMAARFTDARRRGLWHPRRNDVDELLLDILGDEVSP